MRKAPHTARMVMVLPTTQVKGVYAGYLGQDHDSDCSTQGAACKCKAGCATATCSSFGTDATVVARAPVPLFPCSPSSSRAPPPPPVLLPKKTVHSSTVLYSGNPTTSSRRPGLVAVARGARLWVC